MAKVSPLVLIGAAGVGALLLFATTSKGSSRKLSGTPEERTVELLRHPYDYPCSDIELLIRDLAASGKAVDSEVINSLYMATCPQGPEGMPQMPPIPIEPGFERDPVLEKRIEQFARNPYGHSQDQWVMLAADAGEAGYVKFAEVLNNLLESTQFDESGIPIPPTYEELEF